MGALLGTPVWIGFVARALERFAQRLAKAGCDEAMIKRLCAENLLCPMRPHQRDWHTPTPTATIARIPIRGHRAHPRCAAGVVRADRLPIQDRLAGLGVLEGYTGYLVRDDYAGWHQFDTQLAGVYQCAAHLIRHAKGVLGLHPA